MPSIYETLIHDVFFWLTLVAAIVAGFGVHELVRDHIFPDDDDPDGYT